MTTNNYWHTKSKEVKEIYNLRHFPTIMSDRTSALEWAKGMNKLHFVILGDDCKFWVV